MEKSFDKPVVNQTLLLFDSYHAESEKLYQSFVLAGEKLPAIVIEEDGFLPKGIQSVFGYFLGDFKKAKSQEIPGKPRYFNQITVPSFWEISATNSSGSVHNMNKERGRIFFAKPEHKRLVKIVDWLDEEGIVRVSDHYNQYGALWAKTIFNKKGQKVNKTYFDVDGREKIVENYVTNDIILNEEEKVHIFPNRTEFILYYLKVSGRENYRLFFNSLSTPFFVSERLGAKEKAENKPDVLFWHEPVGDEIPGNMQMILKGSATRCEKIFVQRRKSYERLLALGANADMVKALGYLYSFVENKEEKKQEKGQEIQKQNQNQKISFDLLICTNSDQISGLEELVEGLSQNPEIQLHIAAITEMSSKLMAYGQKSNVSLYPGAKSTSFDKLFRRCVVYLDINQGNEIISSVEQAFLHKEIILGFKETCHNDNYIAPEHRYELSEVHRMITDILALAKDSDMRQRYEKRQEDYAFSEEKALFLEQYFSLPY